jgi:hypothetical protein
MVFAPAFGYRRVLLSMSAKNPESRAQPHARASFVPTETMEAAGRFIGVPPNAPQADRFDSGPLKHCIATEYGMTDRLDDAAPSYPAG